MKLLFLLLPIVLLANSLPKDEVYCLKEALYHESRGSSFADQVAVADVILNRVESSRYPNTVCGVVHQAKLWKGNPVRNQCQFSYYCDGRSDHMLDTEAKHNAQLIAIQTLSGSYRGITESSLMYHATYVNPYWAKHYQFVSTIGAHKYYRIKE